MSASKIKRFIIGTASSSSSSTRKRPIDFRDEDDDDDDETDKDNNNDDDDDDNDGKKTRIEEKTTTKGDDRDETKTTKRVRGAIVVRATTSPNDNGGDDDDDSSNPSSVLDPRLSFYIRAYLDVLLSSVLIEKINLAARNKHQSELAIPNVVDNILRYNNIAFSVVRMSTTNIALPEPLWYEIDVINNRLQLYIYQPMYDSFCMTLSDHPVILSSGIVPLDRYDPPEHCPIANSTVDSATINCAVVCDHLAQHVISEVLGPRKAEGASIHERYNERGCTLHSMFDITVLGTGSNSSNNNCSTFVLNQPLTIGGTGSSAFEDLLSTPFHYSK